MARIGPEDGVLTKATGNPAIERIKGSLLLARMKFVKGRGSQAAELVLGRLPREDQVVLRGSLLPSSWYPTGLLLRLETTAADVLAGGDRRSLFAEMGRFTAGTNLRPGGMQRPYLREREPHFLLSNVPRMYTSQHSVGRREYQRLGPTAALIRSLEEEPFSPDDCCTTAGWLEQAIALSGGRDPRVAETQCRAGGAPHCEFHCEWS
jgi:uncharacterized protein (TIGR02265 family)